MTISPFRWILPACFILSGCSGQEESYPSKEIKLIVQAAPGGTSDTVSRVMASLAEGQLDVPIVCENKPGASGALAFSFVARRPADGYTIGHAPVEIAIVRSLGYADIGPSDVSLICLVSKTAPALVVHSDSPWQSFEDFIASAKTETGKIVMANSGIGSIWHFNVLLLEQGTGARFTHLPYGGSTPALVSVIGQHADAAVAGVGEVVSHVQAGSLRALAVFDAGRSGVMSDVPTTHELGYPIGAPAWSGFFGPAGMPPDRVAMLADAFKTAFGTAEWAKLCQERGMEALYLGKDDFAEFALEQQGFFESQIPQLVRLENP
ncbi:MAG: tripartite tricarboxylate transporter substrate binding protein [Bryobacterales bacterium]|nr:tripartite tricarboxylate transporter substrate binding protein [Bryobacterales bacterium]